MAENKIANNNGEEPTETQRNDTGLLVQIPLADYRDLIIAATAQQYEINGLKFEANRQQQIINEAVRAKNEAEEQLEDLKQRYTLIEEWLNSTSYYSGVFEEWAKERDEQGRRKFSNDALTRKKEPDNGETAESDKT